jgi:hypothetical protein
MVKTFIQKNIMKLFLNITKTLDLLTKIKEEVINHP